MGKRSREEGRLTVLRFSREHLWVRVEADRGQIGISNYGQGLFGELIGIELPEIGDRIERGEPFAQVESSRTLYELVAPLNGTVVSANTELEQSPSLANEDPHHEGWLIEVEIEDDGELDDLMGPEEYEEFVAEESD